MEQAPEDAALPEGEGEDRRDDWFVWPESSLFQSISYYAVSFYTVIGHSLLTNAPNMGKSGACGTQAGQYLAISIRTKGEQGYQEYVCKDGTRFCQDVLLNFKNSQ